MTSPRPVYTHDLMLHVQHLRGLGVDWRDVAERLHLPQRSLQSQFSRWKNNSEVNRRWGSCPRRARTRQMITLMEAGTWMSVIAAKLDCSRSLVCNRLDYYGYDPEIRAMYIQEPLE